MSNSNHEQINLPPGAVKLKAVAGNNIPVDKDDKPFLCPMDQSPEEYYGHFGRVIEPGRELEQSPGIDLS